MDSDNSDNVQVEWYNVVDIDTVDMLWAYKLNNTKPELGK